MPLPLSYSWYILPSVLQISFQNALAQGPFSLSLWTDSAHAAVWSIASTCFASSTYHNFQLLAKWFFFAHTTAHCIDSELHRVALAFCQPRGRRAINEQKCLVWLDEVLRRHETTNDVWSWPHLGRLVFLTILQVLKAFSLRRTCVIAIAGNMKWCM